MSNVRSNSNLGNVTDVLQLARYVTVVLEEIVGVINGQIDFETNVRVKVVNVAFPTAAVDTRIPHFLNKVPTGYIIVGLTDPASLYTGTTQWTSTEIYLRSNAVISQARIMVF